MTAQEARRNPVQRLIQASKKEEYEMRLIIWRTKDVPLSSSGSADIQLKVKYSQDGNNDNAILKQTDTHYGSTDGNA